jgi:hypothetical protein
VLWEGSNQGGVEDLDHATFQALQALPVVGLELDASPLRVHKGQASAGAVAGHHDVFEQNSSGARGFDFEQSGVRNNQGALLTFGMPSRLCGADPPPALSDGQFEVLVRKSTRATPIAPPTLCRPRAG